MGFELYCARYCRPANFIGTRGFEPAPKVKALNAWNQGVCGENGFVYVDYYSRMANSEGGLGPELSPDGVHPNKAGYEIMAPLAEAGIAEAFEEAGTVNLPVYQAVSLVFSPLQEARLLPG